MSAQEDLRRDYLALPIFDGFPYLVTQITTVMHHLIPLPRLDAERLIQIAARQYAANRLPTCLVGAEDTALFVSEGGMEFGDVPRCSIPRCCSLLPPEEFVSRELFQRERRLLDFVAGRATSGYLVDRARGRKATPSDWLRLAGTSTEGVPNGLTRCDRCGEWRGQALLDGPDLVVDVFCSCDNHNRCARCLQPFAERRLGACSYFEEERRVLHVPAFAALDHDCPALL